MDEGLPLRADDARTSVDKILHDVKLGNAEVRQEKDMLRGRLRAAVAEAGAGELEEVGSSPLGVDTRSSDVDFTLLLPPGGGRCAGETLERVRQAVDVAGGLRAQVLAGLSFPFLRLTSARAVCDLTVDMRVAVEDRDFLAAHLRDFPAARELIRVLKAWMATRALPKGVDLGPPSVLWHLLALKFAREYPRGTPVERLVFGFVRVMQKLLHHRLHFHMGMEQRLQDGDWKPTGGPQDWRCQGEQILQCQRATGESFGNYSPPGVRLLWAAEFVLASNALQHDCWDAFMFPAPAQELVSPSGPGAPLQAFLAAGRLAVGHAEFFAEPPAGSLGRHRRLPLRVWTSDVGHMLGVMEPFVESNACDWVCSLDAMPDPMSLARLTLMAQMLQGG